MPQPDVFTVRVTDDIAHIDNCPKCEGFGIYARARKAVPMLDAIRGAFQEPSLPCTTCGSDGRGIRRL